MQQHAKTPALRLFAALASIAVVQCASGPSLIRHLTVGTGERAVVALLDEQGSKLSLVNQSSLTAAESKRVRRSDPTLKIVPDDQLQLLLDTFAGLGYFETAVGDRHPEARSWILVQHGATPHILSGWSTDRRDLNRYARCVDALSNIYNANSNFTGSKMSAQELQKFGEDVNQSSADVRAKKRGKNRNP